MSNTVRSIIVESEKKRLKELFYLMDGDNDGCLDYYEMKATLKALGFMVKKSHVLAIIRMYDKYGYNTICFEDFNYVVSQKLTKQSFLDEIKYAFKLFTNNSTNNKITLKDLEGFNEKFDCNLTIEEMELMIEEFDLDHDGSINESEFVELMMDLQI